MTTRMPDTHGRSTADETVQHPLTLVLPIRSSEDFAALRATIEQLQSLPREQNPIIRALDQISTVHFARFVFLDETRLAVITTYDGDFATYINEFVDHIGDVFNALLQHVGDAPPLPVQAHRDEFLAYIRLHDLGCVPPFYSAYPDRTVLDILAAPTG
ncbi:hypothetical protein FHU33_2297 [Blastococcus colisei]|uniref:Uncharacterized protein n=1 Tax=Blastococcus colisei TaxID=1564162 RepID=A0A543PFR0_9ACTN|nr:hypothetical protein [Blastococcus colisei]TQN42886.1 hypothetical protein FHU33_2297 [Blastococcus colisei]